MITKAKKIGKGYSMLVILLLVMLISPLQQLITNAKSGQAIPRAESYWTDVKVAPSGSGTSADPYIIDSAEKLAYLVGDDQWGFRKAYFSQTKDIDLSGRKWKPIGNITASANSIRYNGNGYEISNMTLVDGEDCRGLFGYVWNGTIENVKIVNPNVTGGAQVGGLVGNAEQSWIQNCQVIGGNLQGVIVGGIVGSFAGYMGSFENVLSSANVDATESAGGIIGNIWNQAGGSTTHLIKNAYFTGTAKSAREAGGVVGRINNGAVLGVDLRMENCYSESSLKPTIMCGGLVGVITDGAATVTIQNCGYNGDVEVQGDVSMFGSMIGPVEGTTTTIKQSFGIAEVKGGSIILPFGAENVTWGDCFSYTKQTKGGQLKTYAKYKNIDGMKNFKFNPYINGGYPFPTGMFAVGSMLPAQDIVAYLNSKGFGELRYEVKFLPNSTYGTDYYVELGQYPQTYVGASLNSTLESWYNSTGGKLVGTYTVDNGTNYYSNTYNAYTFVNGKTYVRVGTPIVANNSSIYSDGTAATTSVTWFEVEPIRWLILNYAEFQNGIPPVVVSEKVLTANVTWNNNQTYQNLWSGNCNIRNWLAGFEGLDGENANILGTTLQNNSQSSNMDGTGTSTTNSVWLLSNNEVSGKYFAGTSQRIASPTDFALANNCTLFRFTNNPTTARPDGGGCFYWLRSAAQNTTSAQTVNPLGDLSAFKVDHVYTGVRPALTLRI